MTRSAAVLAALIAATPLSAELPDSLRQHALLPGETTVRFAAGGGEYAFIARGCEGQVTDHLPVHYSEAAGEISHRFADQPVRLGVRAGWIEDRIGLSESGVIAIRDSGTTRITRYANPYLSVETRQFSIGAGWIWHDPEFMTANVDALAKPDHAINDLSAHFVIGNPDLKYFAVRWMESEPLYSGGGYLTFGVGGRTPNQSLDLCGGFATGGPFVGGGLFVNAGYGLPGGVRITLSGRTDLGQANGNGISAGLAYRHRASSP